MARKYATGRRALFICGRCGQRGNFRDSKFDGYFPNLRVHPECWEDKHPQDHLPKVSDPIALWRPSPETPGLIPPMLIGDSGGLAVLLSWTEAVWTEGARPESYRVMRSEDDADYIALADFPIVYDVFAELLSETLAYSDFALEAGHVYTYRIDAVQADGNAINSNLVSFTFDADEESAPRITEDDIVRDAEDGDFRLTEG